LGILRAAPWGLAYLFHGSGFSYNFSFVVQFAFAYVCAMAYVHFAGGAVFAQRDLLSLIVRSSLGTALLGMSSFGIWHITSI
jgi:hypothetical protein